MTFDDSLESSTDLLLVTFLLEICSWITSNSVENEIELSFRGLQCAL